MTSRAIRIRARQLLDSMSESIEVDPSKLAFVEGECITPNGNQVYAVQMNGKTAFVTVPED